MKVQLKWNQDKMDELSHRLEKILFQRQESGILHNTALWSEGIFEAVCSGDEDSLRDLVICSVATVTAHIIREGILDSEMAYSISDACIQMVEDTRREEELFEVAGAFCLTLCRHVKKWKSEYHPLVRQTKEYVFKHFHEKIVIEDMAAQLGVSASYLGLIFRKSEGMTLHQFIVREKVERGKNLLRYSDYDLHTISQYLGFASQSHFGREFKKYTGDTPAAYRARKNQLYRDYL